MDHHNDTSILSGWEDKIINIAKLLKDKKTLDKIFICGYIRPDYSKRVQRNIKPTECYVKNGLLYLRKNGEFLCLHEFISICAEDTNIPEQYCWAFSDLEDCQEFYKKLIELAIQKSEEEIDRYVCNKKEDIKKLSELLK